MIFFENRIYTAGKDELEGVDIITNRHIRVHCHILEHDGPSLFRYGIMHKSLSFIHDCMLASGINKDFCHYLFCLILQEPCSILLHNRQKQCEFYLLKKNSFTVNLVAGKEDEFKSFTNDYRYANAGFKALTLKFALIYDMLKWFGGK